MDKLIIRFNAILLLLLLTTIVLISNNSIIFGQSESSSEQMSTTGQMNGGDMGGNFISSITEWIGVFALGIATGLLAFNIKISNNVAAFVKRRKIILSIVILSLSVGAIHLLLVQEHGKESFWWGVFFLISGIAQIGFGIIIAFIKKPQINNILYYIGNIGNALLVIIFILVRIFIPPFSPEGEPINELEPNGIITLIIEILIVILLIYVMRFKEGIKIINGNH
ncbi:MAG TPA: hypothetical protein VGC75_02865 [Candidatus Nitrosocosmicus sp.]|jgi:hypothetical protein